MMPEENETQLNWWDEVFRRDKRSVTPQGYTGNSAFDILGTLNEGQVASADVRTPFMRMLEAMLGTAFFGSAAPGEAGAANFFQNPQSMFQGMFPGAGQVPGMQPFNPSPGANPALAMLTGGFNTGGLTGGSGSGGAGTTGTGSASGGGGGGSGLPGLPAPPPSGPVGPSGPTVPAQGTPVNVGDKFAGVDPGVVEATLGALNLPMRGGEGMPASVPTQGRSALPGFTNILQSFLGGGDPGSVYGFSKSFNRLGNLLEGGATPEDITGDWGKFAQFIQPAQQAIDFFGGLQSGDYSLDRNSMQALEQFNAAKEAGGFEGFDLGNMNQYYGDAANWLASQLKSLGFDTASTGGLLDPNKPTLVGEAGPELLMGNQIIPLQTAQTGGAFMPPPPTTDPTIIHPQSWFNFEQQPTSGLRDDPNNPYLDDPTRTDPNGTLTQPNIQPTQPGTTDGGFPSFGAPDMFGNIFSQGSPFANLLNQNPEMQAFNTANNLLGQNFFGQNPGQGVLDALQPKFQENLQFGLGELANRAPSVSNSAMRLEGTDLTQRAMNDYNLLGSQALQQGLNQQLGGLGTLGQMAGQAGQNPFQRMLGAGQLGAQTSQGLLNLSQQQNQFQNMFGLQAQNQQFQQTVLPALQMLMSMMGMAGPTGYQTVARGG